MGVYEIIKKNGLLKGLSPRTISTYAFVVGKFLRVHKKEPHQITKNEVQNYLLGLLEKGSPGNTINVYLNGLKFFFEECLGRKLTAKIKYYKIPQKLPEFLTQEETIRFFSVIVNKKHKLMITLLYSTGLRVSELLNLKVNDFQFEENYGWVRQGKGNKDRPFIIAEKLKQEVVSWIEKNQLDFQNLLFSNKNKKMSSQTVRKVIKRAVNTAKIKKNVHPHTLRHSFATHLLENDYAVTDVQGLLGHSKVDTTLIYTHLAKPKLFSIKSPFDNLPERKLENKCLVSNV